ncbi:putative membrane protein [Streptococcus pneumoniae GA40563]|nr:putative membrane protein [Streptococcus pneumoniae GA40563]
MYATNWTYGAVWGYIWCGTYQSMSYFFFNNSWSVLRMD